MLLFSRITLLLAWQHIATATEWVQGNCPPIDMPKVDMQYMHSQGYPNLSTEGGECKFTLKIEPGNYIKMESPQVDLKCGEGSYGITVSDYSVTGQVITTKPFCDTNVIPLFVSTGTHMEVNVKYGVGDRFQIGFKILGDMKGKFVRDYAPPPPPPPPRRAMQQQRMGLQNVPYGNQRSVIPVGAPLYPGLGPIPPRLGPRGQQMTGPGPPMGGPPMRVPPVRGPPMRGPPIQNQMYPPQGPPQMPPRMGGPSSGPISQTQGSFGPPIQNPNAQGGVPSGPVAPSSNEASSVGTGGRPIDVAKTRILMGNNSGVRSPNQEKSYQEPLSPQVQRERQRKAVVVIVVISMLAILLIGGCIVGFSVYKSNDRS